jgi:hypothetical protein
MTSLRYQAGMLLQNTALRQRPRTQDKVGATTDISLSLVIFSDIFFDLGME